MTFFRRIFFCSARGERTAAICQVLDLPEGGRCPLTFSKSFYNWMWTKLSNCNQTICQESNLRHWPCVHFPWGTRRKVVSTITYTLAKIIGRFSKQSSTHWCNEMFHCTVSFHLKNAVYFTIWRTLETLSLVILLSGCRPPLGPFHGSSCDHTCTIAAILIFPNCL